MREDDRGLRNIQHGLHRIRCDVRNIDQHAQFVHRLDDFFAELAQACALGFVGTRVSPIQRITMRERHVPGTHRVQSSQLFNRVFDRVSTFDANERRDLAGSASSFDILDRARCGECLWVARDHSLHDLDLLDGHLMSRAVVGSVRWDIDRPELRADIACVQSRNIGMQLRLRLSDIDFLKRA